MKRIKIRRHKRKSRSGKISIVKQHTRRLKASETITLQHEKYVLSNAAYKTSEIFEKYASEYDLPLFLTKSVTDRALYYYQQFPKYSDIRRMDRLIQVCFFLECLENNIFLPWPVMMKGEDESKLKRVLNAIFQLDPELFKSFKTRDFRIKRIDNMLKSLSRRFDMPEEFYKITSENLMNNFPNLVNVKDTAIAGLLWDDYVRRHTQFKGTTEVNLRKGADFLGTMPSTPIRLRKRAMELGMKLKQPPSVDDILNELWFLF
jgi:hypothetical protein